MCKDIQTPSRKHLGKAVTRGSRTKIATECLQGPKTKDCVNKRIGHEMRKEIKVMCSDATASILRSDKKNIYHHFMGTYFTIRSKLGKYLTNPPG